MTVFLKFIHLAAIAVWSGGLLVLPFLFWQRATVAAGPDLDRLHRLTRFVYVGMTSPAAVVAIGSGTALIFLQATFQEWFSLKMVLVVGMVMLHVVAGLVLAHLFLPDGRFGLVPHMRDIGPEQVSRTSNAGTGVVDVDASRQGGGVELTIHRIDEEFLIKDVEKAGFKLYGASSALRHPEDDRTWLVFKHRGETDRFMLKFVKAPAVAMEADGSGADQ